MNHRALLEDRVPLVSITGQLLNALPPVFGQDKWDDPAAFIGEDAEGILHWPGFGADAASYLIAERGAVGLGTDTHGVDPGNDEEFGASFAMYDADGMILECLAGLDQLPPTGATLVVGGWPIEGGSGSPARVFAFLPPAD